MDCSEEKKYYREKIFACRQQISGEQKAVWDQKILKRLLPVLEGWQEVWLYVDVRMEAGTESILEACWERGIRTAVPRVEQGASGKELGFYYIRSRKELAPAPFGLLEPIAACRRAEQDHAPVIVPGVAFSPSGERIGYGAGFYDRFLKREPYHPTAGIAYDFQVFPALPVTDRDVSVLRVITPENCFFGKKERSAR